MKIAKVVPIYESGNNQLFTNYRPASLLPQFSKILEKLFNCRLMSYVNKSDILYNGQYGFRQKISTALAILDLIEEITTNIDKGNVTVGVFIDLKKAFDTIDHEILLNKLRVYGIRGPASNWLKSYLADRKQFVSFNDVISDYLDVACGIPQGSIIGPTLFILYINDLHNVSKILNFILFADDTNIFLSGKKLIDVCNLLTNELKSLDVWFKVNKLSLNVSKTNFMVFGNKKNEKCHIYVNEVEIDEVKSAKFLGVIIDNKLNWSMHIKQVQSKISKSISIMYKVKYLLDTSALLTLYNSLILPYLNYCVEAWGNTYTTNLSRITKLQKRAIRIVGNLDFNGHTNPVFAELKLLKFEDIVKVNTGVVMYKGFYGLLNDRLSKHLTISNTNTRQKMNFYVKSKRTRLKSFCISCYGVSLWNGLDISIRSSSTLISLKKKNKKMFIEKYFEEIN